MTKIYRLRRGLINKTFIKRICNNLRNPGRKQMAAAFLAGMVLTAATAYFAAGTGLPADNGSNVVPERDTPGNYVPEKYPVIVPEGYFNYVLVYAFKEGALIFG
jgi:hypothetical protein